MLGKSVPPGDLLDRADDALISARGRARKISQQAMPVLYPARICDLWLARFRACGADPWKVDLAMAPVTPVWRILTGRILGRF